MASTSSQPTALAHGVAGAVASVGALALLYPLDQLRTLQQLGLAPARASEANRAKFGVRSTAIGGTMFSIKGSAPV